MPMSNRGLTKLVEECGEVIQVAAKRIAYPDVITHPDGSRLDERLESELGDMMAAARFVIKKMGLNSDHVNARFLTKFAQFEAWDNE